MPRVDFCSCKIDIPAIHGHHAKDGKERRLAATDKIATKTGRGSFQDERYAEDARAERQRAAIYRMYSMSRAHGRAGATSSSHRQNYSKSRMRKSIDAYFFPLHSSG